MGILKAAVIGLGESRNLFNSSEYELSIGVNDIWRYVHTDYVVCVDYPRIFTPDRIKVINESKPKIFFSQFFQWNTRSDYEKIYITAGYPDFVCNLDQPAYCKSYCSPFIAAQVAYKRFGASEIHLFGVDLLNHPHLNITLCAKIKIHFSNLKKALDAKGCKLIVHGSGILAVQL